MRLPSHMEKRYETRVSTFTRPSRERTFSPRRGINPHIRPRLQRNTGDNVPYFERTGNKRAVYRNAKDKCAVSRRVRKFIRAREHMKTRKRDAVTARRDSVRLSAKSPRNGECAQNMREYFITSEQSRGMLSKISPNFRKQRARARYLRGKPARASRQPLVSRAFIIGEFHLI